MTSTQLTDGIRPRWGSHEREKKAEAILTTLRAYLKDSIDQATWCDLGCGSGGIAATIAPSTEFIVGVDPEPWPEWPRLTKVQPMLQFVVAPAERCPLNDQSVDVLICNQVYEHVADPVCLVREILRVLKPGGTCYFAGPNLLFPIEPHVFWPFVHWLPRRFAITLMRMAGSTAILDAYSASYWTLRRWLQPFAVRNAVPYIIRHPHLYGRQSWPWRILSRMPWRLLDLLTWLSPTFVFILRKAPANPQEDRPL